MKKNVNLSIGIPLYNEEKNIEQLLNSLLSQKGPGFSVKEIIIVSDGSTDNSIKIIKEIKSNRIKIINHADRLGKSARLNEIFRMFLGDALVLCDGDVLIKDNLFLSKVVKSINFKKVGLAGISALPYQPNNYFQSAIEIGCLAVNEIAAKWRKGRNYLAFKGCFLVLNRNFAKSLEISENVINDDAYLYFSAIDKGYSTAFLKDVLVYFRVPKTFSDHIKQSKRFQASKEEMQKHFNIDVNTEYKMPFTILLGAFVKYIFISPLSTGCYLIINAISALEKSKSVESTWNIASSTKS